MSLKKCCYPVIWVVFLLTIGGNSQAETVVNQSTLKKVQQNYGVEASQNVAKWNDLIETLKAKNTQQQLTMVNGFFNRQDFVDDIIHWNKQDYWATPIEFIASGGGDCEDFSIAKYFSMRALGVPASKLRLMYVKALDFNMAHMVLAYYDKPNAIPLVLDNLNKKILPANMRPDLLPVYSFNGEGLWRAKEQGRGKKLQAGGNNSLWQDLINRMNLQRSNGS
jgi:predicted transglutaminase-like cysteine proteinase